LYLYVITNANIVPKNITNSPPFPNADNCSQHIRQLMPDFKNLAENNSKVFGSYRSVNRNLDSFKGDMSTSLKEEDFELVRTSKPSFTATDENFSETKQRYEHEIRILKETISNASEREDKLMKKVKNLEKENKDLKSKIKNIEIESIKKSILSEKYKDMDEFINKLFIYIDNIPEQK